MYRFRQMLLPQDELVVTLTHLNPKVYPAISDDYSPKPENYKLSDQFLYFGAFDGDEYLGGWSLRFETGSCIVVHTNLLPKAWGRAVAVGKEFETWFWENVPQVTCLISHIPEDNKLALRLALKCGFEKWGFLPSAIKKNGKVLGMHLVGKSRENK